MRRPARWSRFSRRRGYSHEPDSRLERQGFPSFRHVCAEEFPQQHGDNCLLTINFGFVDSPFYRLLALSKQLRGPLSARGQRKEVYGTSSRGRFVSFRESAATRANASKPHEGC